MAENRSGSTMLIRLLATSDEVVFDRRYPAEYQFVSYFARMASDCGVRVGLATTEEVASHNQQRLSLTMRDYINLHGRNDFTKCNPPSPGQLIPVRTT